MFAITADQVDSRHRPDLAASTMRALELELANGLVLPIDRTAGDEIQLLLATGETALTAVLSLTRGGQWSVGCGIGAVALPLPANVREAGGGAFIAAREAVNEAKRRETRFALRSMAPGAETGTATGTARKSETGGAIAAGTEAADAEAFIDLLLQLRTRRSAPGWQMSDLLRAGKSQAEAAKVLGISPQAASKRAAAAGLRIEFASIAPLARRLDAVDRC